MKKRSHTITFRGKAARLAFEAITGTKIKPSETPKPKIAQFQTSREDHDLLNQIADRAVVMAKAAGVDYDKLTASMDVTACHCNGCALDLPKLLAAPDADFGHDIFGIRRHIDRTSGELRNLFVPRCALPENAVR